MDIILYSPIHLKMHFLVLWIKRLRKDSMAVFLITHYRFYFTRVSKIRTCFQNIWSFVVAVLFLGALAGSFSIPFIAEGVGRKNGLYISISVGVLAGGMSIASKFVSLLQILDFSVKNWTSDPIIRVIHYLTSCDGLVCICEPWTLRNLSFWGEVGAGFHFTLDLLNLQSETKSWSNRNDDWYCNSIGYCCWFSRSYASDFWDWWFMVSFLILKCRL